MKKEGLISSFILASVCFDLPKALYMCIRMRHRLSSTFKTGWSRTTCMEKAKTASSRALRHPCNNTSISESRLSTRFTRNHTYSIQLAAKRCCQRGKEFLTQCAENKRGATRTLHCGELSPPGPLTGDGIVAANGSSSFIRLKWKEYVLSPMSHSPPSTSPPLK